MPSKLPTIKQIAHELKISPSTVSRALHDHPSIGLTTRLKVQKMAAEMNYEPNQTAIFLQRGRTNTIGVVLPELSENFFSTVISAIEETAYKRNYTILLAQSHDDPEKEKQLIEKMRHHRVDGLLVSLAKNTTSLEHFEKLKNYGIPVVFLDRIPALPNIHSVSCNMQTGTIEAVSYLLKRGHRTIGMINGPNTLLASNERKEGYIQAMTKSRLKYDSSLIVNCDLTEKGTEDALAELLNNKRKVTAIVTFNDYVALFAIKKTRQILANDAVSPEFVSYANLPIIRYMDYRPVASVEQFPFLQGVKATDLLLDLLSKKNVLPTDSGPFYNLVVESKLIEN